MSAVKAPASSRFMMISLLRGGLRARGPGREGCRVLVGEPLRSTS